MGMLKGFGPGTDKHKPKKKRKPTKAQQQTKQDGEDLLAKWASVPSFASGIYGEKVPKKTKAVERRAIPDSLIQEKLKDFRALPSLETAENATTKKSKPVYTDEDLNKREVKARERTFVTAPVANKMGYQLITDPEHLKTMGRKI
jgi:hypothetical protein